MAERKSDSENRRTFLKRGAITFGAASAASAAPEALFAEEGHHEWSGRQPGCDYTEVIGGNQYGFRVFGSATPRHHAFYFHGMPVSRLDACILHQVAANHGVQIISVDRPGIGLSCYQPVARFLLSCVAAPQSREINLSNGSHLCLPTSNLFRVTDQNFGDTIWRIH